MRTRAVTADELHPDALPRCLCSSCCALDPSRLAQRGRNNAAARRQLDRGAEYRASHPRQSRKAAP